ncbi:MAG: sigma-70 family RNA polymerase sigma factor [Sedimentisphaerales bacterium]|nr:sigma-70 family RNA polymerase sigma factor [Sedimentisphaerales bacterium]
MDEGQIIKSVLQDDIESFGLLVKRYQRPVVAMVRDMTGDVHLAEDVAQDVFLTAFQKLHTYDPSRSRFCTWLFTIARNKSVNAIKHRRLRRIRPIRQGQQNMNPADQTETEELTQRLEAAIEALPIRLKTVFILAVFYELPYDEIARIERIRVGTVKSRVSRARKKLAASINGYPGDDE